MGIHEELVLRIIFGLGSTRYDFEVTSNDLGVGQLFQLTSEFLDRYVWQRNRIQPVFAYKFIRYKYQRLKCHCI